MGGVAAVEEDGWVEASGKCVAVELSAVGLLIPDHTQIMVGLTAKISQVRPPGTPNQHTKPWCFG